MVKLQSGCLKSYQVRLKGPLGYQELAGIGSPQGSTEEDAVHERNVPPAMKGNPYPGRWVSSFLNRRKYVVTVLRLISFVTTRKILLAFAGVLDSSGGDSYCICGRMVTLEWRGS